MSDAPTEPAPTEELSVGALAAFHAMTLLDAAEQVIDDMRHQVDEVEARCAATRRRARRHARDR